MARAEGGREGTWSEGKQPCLETVLSPNGLS
eukprot:CAMPEP_0117563510 /NCGR_PEP_ID=MMETSP0784-20121206/55535_1 /TAXON_ID=39447 /ORGANISM="" /LENGTH=30 /DNA_ID= /DNA_START= /DNA_END= /DNA_ORIENTATION=